MEKNKKRALRRTQKERAQRKIERKINQQYSSNVWNGFEEWKEAYIKRHADNPTSCSCHMCGNPRRIWNETTIQEKKFMESIKCE
jgi:hypothetical protein